jgi:GH35 family endo-1,4-beta-xylanase
VCGAVALAGDAAPLPSPSSANPPRSQQIGVMLQLGNMLPKSGNWEGRVGDVDKEFALLEQAGVRWSRDQIAWEQIEMQPGTFNWSAADQLVASAKAHHVELVWIVGNTAPWDSTNGDWTGVPKDLSDPNGYFVRFVRNLATRYHNDIHYWEIRNEPNLPDVWQGGSPQKYVTYLSEASATIRAIDPQATVVFGGLGGSIPQETTWFQQVMNNIDRAHLPFDVVNFHLYGMEADTHGYRGQGAVVRYVDDSMQQIDSTVAAAGLTGMPVWLTEFDFSATVDRQTDDPDYHNGESSQVRFVQQILPRVVTNHPERRIFWASLLDDYDDPGFESVGLVTSDAQHHVGTPRQSYYALAQLLAAVPRHRAVRH